MTELEFGARLKQLRQEKRLTQQELADQLGVSNKSVSRWESGGYPDISLLAPLAKALGVSVDELLGCQPPLRSFGRSDWQNLMSYAFAIGGGVAFYLLDLFMPMFICYLLYLAAMAYGVYLQRYYTYHSHWFYGANALMDFVINLQVISGIPGMKEMAVSSLWGQMGSALSSGAIPVATLGVWLWELLPYLALWVLLALVLTGLTQLVICRSAGGTGQWRKLNWRVEKVPLRRRKLLPLLSPVLLSAFYLPYLSQNPLPQWLYVRQGELFWIVWLVLLVVWAVYLLKHNEKWMLLPAGVMHLGCLSLMLVANQARMYSTKSATLIQPNPAHSYKEIYIRFGEFGWEIAAAAAVLMLLYVVCCRIRIEMKTSQ